VWHHHFIYPVYTGVEKFRDEFAIARSTLGTPSGPLPIGAGFLGWKLDEPGSPHVQLLEVALENGVRAIWLSFGEDLGRWIEFVRNHDQQTGKSPKTLVFVLVNSVDEALVAAQSWKVDVLVAQGKIRLATTTPPLGPAFITHHMLFFSPLLTPFQESNRADMAQVPLHPSSISFPIYCPHFPPQEPHPYSRRADCPTVDTSPRS
jgi:hypothetical protein